MRTVYAGNTTINKTCGSRIGRDRGIIEALKGIAVEHKRPILEHNPPRSSCKWRFVGNDNAA